jgi:uncharacterized protein (DUF305 family)
MRSTADVRFAQEMIPHHEAAVRMAKRVLAKGINPEIEDLAKKIIKAQEAEIDFLKDWLRRNGEPLSGGDSDDMKM